MKHLISIYRDHALPSATMGLLYYGKDFFCHTVEDAVRAPGVKIPGKTALPAGACFGQVTWSPRFERDLIQLSTQPESVEYRRGDVCFMGVRIHRGNTAGDSSGCIIVGYGRSVKQGTVANSAKAEIELVELVKKDVGNDVFLVTIGELWR